MVTRCLKLLVFFLYYNWETKEWRMEFQCSQRPLEDSKSLPMFGKHLAFLTDLRLLCRLLSGSWQSPTKVELISLILPRSTPRESKSVPICGSEVASARTNRPCPKHCWPAGEKGLPFPHVWMALLFSPPLPPSPGLGILTISSPLCPPKPSHLWSLHDEWTRSNCHGLRKGKKWLGPEW